MDEDNVEHLEGHEEIVDGEEMIEHEGEIGQMMEGQPDYGDEMQ